MTFVWNYVTRLDLVILIEGDQTKSFQFKHHCYGQIQTNQHWNERKKTKKKKSQRNETEHAIDIYFKSVSH